MRFAAAVCVGVLLLFTYHLYGYAYLSTDDFNNLYWAQRQNASQTIHQLLNPASDAFRPTGMTFYWILFNLFHVNAAPYHWVAWILHAINTGLVYLILKRILNGRSGAAVGAMLFASQAAFADIYWNFGSIFEVACAFGFFAGVLWWMNENRTWKTILGCTLVFLFALKAKEMAITLPAVWLLCDLLLRKRKIITATSNVVLPAAVGLWYGLRKFEQMGQSKPTGIYYMDVSWITLGRSLGVFFNSVLDMGMRWQLWAIAFVLLLLIFALRKNRVGAFFQAYFVITFLPVIFMINHRELYLSYIPFVGLCGLAGLLVQSIANVLESRMGIVRASLAAYLVFPALCLGTYAIQRAESEERRTWQKPMSLDYRAFVSGLRALPRPQADEAVFFDSHPLYFTEDLLRNATEVAWQRTGMNVQLVSTFPPEARYKLHYENSRLTQVP